MNRQQTKIDVLDLVIQVLMDREKEMDRMIAELARLSSILGDLVDRLEQLQNAKMPKQGEPSNEKEDKHIRP